MVREFDTKSGAAPGSPIRPKMEHEARLIAPGVGSGWLGPTACVGGRYRC